MRKWKVTLYNQHAMCGISAEGRTRRQAFDAAFHKAGPHHRWFGLVHKHFTSGRGCDVMWLAAFNDCVAYMRRGTTASTLTNPHGFAVEVRRI